MRGDIIEAQIVQIVDGTVFVDIGASRDAVVPHDDLARLGEEWLQNVSPGDQVPVRVMQTPAETGRLVVSIEKGLAVRDWERAQKALDEDEVLELEVTGQNSGGLLLAFGFIEGFVPNSHIPNCRGLRDRRILSQRKAEHVGHRLPVKVLELDMRSERLVLSATRAASEHAAARLAELSVGQIVTGRVVNVVKFGAFIELGGVQGLVHVSNLSWEKVRQPGDVLSEGEEIEVKITGIDRQQGRINLSRKALLPSPWDQVADTYSHGDLVTGRVTNVADFGIFVRLPEGVEGLVHESEMLNYQREMLRKGDEVLVRILRIQPEQQRLGLSLRAVTPDEEMAWMASRQESGLDEEE